MNKIALIALPIIALTLFVGTAGADEKSAKPFQALWDAVAHLQEQIDAIELIPGPKGDKGDPGAQGPQGEKGEPGEPGRDGASLHLYDGNRQDLGILLHAHPFGVRFTTYHPAIGGALEFEQHRTLGSRTIVLSNHGGVYFAGENCTGQAYVGSHGAPNGLYVAAHGTRIFKFTLDDVVTGIQPKSVLEGSTCVNSLPGVGTVALVEEIPVPFDLPLAWPLQVRTAP